MKTVSAIILSGLCAAPFCAHAEWQTTIEESAFSNLKSGTMINTLSAEKNIVFDCKGAGLSIAFLEQAERRPGEDFKNLKYVPMALKVDGKTLPLGDGSILRRNDHYIAIEAIDDMAAYRALKMVRDAKRSIVLSVQSGAETFNVIFPASGSTQAADKLSNACGLGINIPGNIPN